MKELYGVNQQKINNKGGIPFSVFYIYLVRMVCMWIYGAKMNNLVTSKNQ